MVQGRINIVDSDRVYTELLHKGSVTKTASTVAQRVSLGGGTERVGTAWLIPGQTCQSYFFQLWSRLCNARSTNDLEAIACNIVDKICALNSHVWYG